MLPHNKTVPNTRKTGLGRDLGVPLYHQIQHLLRHRIHSGLYQPGTQIPSEHELSRELAVSRVTLREALRELVREHLLIKVQGKGTFVSSDPPLVLFALFFGCALSGYVFLAWRWYQHRPCPAKPAPAGDQAVGVADIDRRRVGGDQPQR